MDKSSPPLSKDAPSVRHHIGLIKPQSFDEIGVDSGVAPKGKAGNGERDDFAADGAGNGEPHHVHQVEVDAQFAGEPGGHDRGASGRAGKIGSTDDVHAPSSCENPARGNRRDERSRRNGKKKHRSPIGNNGA